MSVFLAAVILIVLILIAYVEYKYQHAKKQITKFGAENGAKSGPDPASAPDSFCGDLSTISGMAQTYLDNLVSSYPTYAKAFTPVAQKIGITFTTSQCDDPTQSMMMWVLGAASDLGGYIGILLKDGAPSTPMKGAKDISAALAKFISNYS